MYLYAPYKIIVIMTYDLEACGAIGGQYSSAN
jgi:hypothetical protein